MIRFDAVAAIAAVLTACSVSQDREVALGRQNADEIKTQLPLVTDPAVSDYIQTLGESIAKKTSRADLDWHFYVVNTKQVNAFAIPGGYVYVNRGLIEKSDRLDELTGAMGHEIGHVVQRHSVKQIQKQEGANLGLVALCTLTNICHTGIGVVAVRVGSDALFARYSRHDELQADSEAVVNVTRAGYEPKGVTDLFEVLLNERKYQPTLVDGWFASHPLEETRIRRADAWIAQVKRDPSNPPIVDSPDFQAFKARVIALPPPPPPPSPPPQGENNQR